MWYTILLKCAFTHYDTFYYYIMSAPFCQGRFFIFVGMPMIKQNPFRFSVILHKPQTHLFFHPNASKKIFVSGLLFPKIMVYLKAYSAALLRLTILKK